MQLIIGASRRERGFAPDMTKCCRVKGLSLGGPGAEAGLQVGDVIVSVDGKSAMSQLVLKPMSQPILEPRSHTYEVYYPTTQERGWFETAGGYGLAITVEPTIGGAEAVLQRSFSPDLFVVLWRHGEFESLLRLTTRHTGLNPHSPGNWPAPLTYYDNTCKGRFVDPCLGAFRALFGAARAPVAAVDVLFQGVAMLELGVGGLAGLKLVFYFDPDGHTQEFGAICDLYKARFAFLLSDAYTVNPHHRPMIEQVLNESAYTLDFCDCENSSSHAHRLAREVGIALTYEPPGARLAPGPVPLPTQQPYLAFPLDNLLGGGRLTLRDVFASMRDGQIMILILNAFYRANGPYNALMRELLYIARALGRAGKLAGVTNVIKAKNPAGYRARYPQWLVAEDTFAAEMPVPLRILQDSSPESNTAQDDFQGVLETCMQTSIDGVPFVFLISDRGKLVQPAKDVSEGSSDGTIFIWDELSGHSKTSPRADVKPVATAINIV